jgi:hypothetical protein
MTALRLEDDLAEEIEEKLREMGSVLVSQAWNCSVQFFYQQLDSESTMVINKDIPVFTAVVVDENEFIVSENSDNIRVSEQLTIPAISIDITEIDSRVFEKLNVFNLTKKTTIKKLKFAFKHFQIGEFHLLLNQQVLIINGPENHNPLENIVPFARVKNLSLNAGFVRPKWETLCQSAKVAFWIYQLAKQTERVFPPENFPTQVDFKDCISAKDYLLV